jgi:hypothetical protein
MSILLIGFELLIPAVLLLMLWRIWPKAGNPGNSPNPNPPKPQEAGTLQAILPPPDESGNAKQ